MSKQPLLMLNYKQVSTIIDTLYPAIFSAIEKAYLLLGEGEALNPSSLLIWYNKNQKKRVIALPAYIGGEFKRPGLKWIASCPENIEKGLPRASALLILNDEQTGFPIAILEASKISAVRTVLSAILVLKYFRPNLSISSMALIGVGNIARHFLHSLHHLNWTVKTIYLYDHAKQQLQNFKHEFPQYTFIVVDTPELAIESSEVTLLATTSTIPTLFHLNLKPNSLILNLSLRDLSPEIILKANNIVDEIEHVLSSDTSISLAYEVNKNLSFINGTIFQLLSGLMHLDLIKPTIVSPMGLGVLDVMVGEVIYQFAQQHNIGSKIHDFF